MTAGKGYTDGRPDRVRMTISMDDETFEEARALALKEGISMGAQFRVLIGLGLAKLQEDKKNV